MVCAMNLIPTAIPGLSIAHTKYVGDTRGTFARLFCEQELASSLAHRHIVQINHSCTRTPGAVRGLHFQRAPYAEMKLVRCIRGRVWDVAVDLRAGSATFLQWHAEELTPQSGLMMMIPEGFAHGFQVLDADSELLYLHTAAFAPEFEGGIAHDDPALAIPWPLTVVDLSTRDRQHAAIDANFSGIII